MGTCFSANIDSESTPYIVIQPLLEDDSKNILFSPKQQLNNDKLVVEKTNPDGSFVIINGSILTMSSGRILPKITDNKTDFNLISIYFNNKKNPKYSIYIIRHIYNKYDEFHISFTQTLPMSNKIRYYWKFLNGEISEANFRKSLRIDFPKYHIKFWEILSNEKLVSFRLYKSNCS